MDVQISPGLVSSMQKLEEYLREMNSRNRLYYIRSKTAAMPKPPPPQIHSRP